MPATTKAPAHDTTHGPACTDPSDDSSVGAGDVLAQRTTAVVDPLYPATSGSTGYDYVGVLTVDAEGCAMRFEERQYLLAGSAANYDTLFSMLLACWLEGHKVKFEYTSTTAPDAPRHVVSLTTLPL